MLQLSTDDEISKEGAENNKGSGRAWPSVVLSHLKSSNCGAINNHDNGGDGSRPPPHPRQSWE